jgi:hypothetical protein
MGDDQAFMIRRAARLLNCEAFMVRHTALD